MAKYTGADVAQIVVGGRWYTGLVTSLEWQTEAETEDTTVLGSLWQDHVFSGVRRFRATIDLFADDSLYTTPVTGTQYPVVIQLAGNAANRPALVGYGSVVDTQSRSIRVGEVLKERLTVVGVGWAYDAVAAKTVLPHATRSTAGNTDATPCDDGAQTTSGGALVACVASLTLGGYTDLTIKLRDSADGTTFADVTGASLTFTTAGVQVVEVAGTLRRYVSASWAWTGSGSGQSFAGLAVYGRK